MAQGNLTVGRRVFLPKSGLGGLVAALQQRGYTVLGPRLASGAVSLSPINSVDDLPRGWSDDQSPGRYRLTQSDPDLMFEHVVGPDGPKRYLLPPTQRLYRMKVQDGRMVFEAGLPQPPKLAVLGLRPCELAAIKVQDRVFAADDENAARCETDAYYYKTRRNMFLAVVNCTRPGGSCFCASMGTGPQAGAGFDLALTELRGGFVVAADSPRGVEVLGALEVREPSSAELELADLKLRQATEHMGRRLDTTGLVDALARAVEHPRWDEVARRCLGCTNCTQVCPTCFCTTVVDSNDLHSGSVTRTWQWESCYTLQFSYTTAGPVRNTVRARYRQWLRHKLGTWWEQFGTSGCVGCGRCITWCPVGIDITEEAAVIRGPAAPR